MDYYRPDYKDVVVKEDKGSNVATNLIWAVTILALAGIIVYTVFFSGVLNKVNRHKIGVDVNVSAPANTR